MAIKDLMARVERSGSSGAGSASAPPPGAGAAAPIPRTVAPATSVDAASELEGTLRCRDLLRIDGRVVGRIECEKSVLVGERARIEASIAAQEVTVAGLVEGDITAGRKITLEKTAVVRGDLSTPGIVIEEGAKVKGRILIGADAQASAGAPKQAESAQASGPRKAKAAPSAPSAEEPAPRAAAAG